jgi:predicted DsbA family dithiol-disulfide isomerase
MQIDIISDVVCPWCYVGKRQFEAALAQFSAVHPAEPIHVQWHPFQLNPQLQVGGMSRADYLQQKFGSADPAPIYARVKQAAAQVALDLPVEGIKKQPNTALAHSIISAAADAEQQERIVEALFKAYFVDHQDLTDAAVLQQIALSADYTTEQAEAAASKPALTEVQERDAQVRAQGISGVPFFVVNQTKAVSGAVGTQALFELLCDARQTAS